MFVYILSLTCQDYHLLQVANEETCLDLFHQWMDNKILLWLKMRPSRKINQLLKTIGCDHQVLQLRSRIHGEKGPAINAHVITARATSQKEPAATQDKIKHQCLTASGHTSKVPAPMKP